MRGEMNYQGPRAKLNSMKQQIYFITGKGGVGKSTFAAALAYKKAQEGLKTVLIELGDVSFYQDFLDLKESVGFTPIKTSLGFDVSLFSGPDCLREYAIHLLKLETLYKLFFENSISKSLIQIAPGLKELSILGKITSKFRKHGPPLNYDCVIVDSYSSGHFLALVNAPQAMAEVVPFGPMGEQSRGIHQVIINPEVCKYIIVSLPEDLPMKESEELQASLKQQTGVKSEIYINRSYAALFEHLPAVDFSKEKSDSFTRQLQKKLDKEKNFKQKKLPILFTHDPQKIIQNLSGELHASI